MLKEEFENMIGKQVTYDTFKLYENMYTALPETVNKQQFVEMLNIKAIPEDPAAIERRQEAEKMGQELRGKIQEKRKEILKDCH